MQGDKRSQLFNQFRWRSREAWVLRLTAGSSGTGIFGPRPCSHIQFCSTLHPLACRNASSFAGRPNRPSLHLRERNSSMKNRKREICRSWANTGNGQLWAARRPQRPASLVSDFASGCCKNTTQRWRPGSTIPTGCGVSRSLCESMALACFGCQAAYGTEPRRG